MMRGTPRMRLALGILSPVFLALCLWAIRGEEARPWMWYQEKFKKLYVAAVTAKRLDAEQRGDATETTRWQRVIDEVSQQPPEIAQIYLEELQVADRCSTCHAGIDNQLFREAPQPFRTHPGDLLAHHEINRFGCTPCHDGQGMATTVDAAHGKEANWPNAMLPTAFLQSSCARCHEVTHGVQGTEVVSRGNDLFLEKGCYGCHDIKEVSYLPKFGPPLSHIRSKLANATDWTYGWVKDPTAFNPETAMPHFLITDEEVGKMTAFLLSLSAPAA
ncbi:MAG: hypothetical protein A3J75_03695, partial [Acidobacteria bacterium RBG_16_68_9]